MGKKYDVNDDKRVVELCLNCDKAVCRGVCLELKMLKERIQRNAKSGVAR